MIHTHKILLSIANTEKSLQFQEANTIFGSI